MDRATATRRYIEIMKNASSNTFDNPELDLLRPLVDMEVLEIELGCGIQNWSRPIATILPYPHKIIFPDEKE